MKKLNVLMTAIAAAALAAYGSAASAADLTLNLAHNQNETHPVHQAIQKFADAVKEKTSDRINIRIFPNAQLGSETECLEQLKAGVLPITKVSAPGLA
nr:TRAP transporter substrate-binding protein DctP [Succinivibrionaceae bacterium]